VNEITGRELSTTRPQARKPYPCYVCGKLIDQGERHTRQVGIWDGDFISVRAHNCCLHGLYCEHLS
jgi:hypothetical protein